MNEPSLYGDAMMYMTLARCYYIESLEILEYSWDGNPYAKYTSAFLKFMTFSRVTQFQPMNKLQQESLSQSEKDTIVSSSKNPTRFLYWTFI